MEGRLKYIETIERELREPRLELDEYVKVPLSPLEVFSVVNLYNSLTDDKLLRPEHVIEKLADTPADFVEVIEILENEDGIFAVNVDREVFVIRTNEEKIKEVVVNSYFDVVNAVRDEFDAEMQMGLFDKNAMLLVFAPKDRPAYSTENPNTMALMAANKTWNIKSINIRSLRATIYYKENNGYVRVLVYSDVFQSYTSCLIKYNFKEHLNY